MREVIQEEQLGAGDNFLVALKGPHLWADDDDSIISIIRQGV